MDLVARAHDARLIGSVLILLLFLPSAGAAAGAARQPLFSEPLSHAVLSHAAVAVECASDDCLDRRGALHREDGHQPVRRGESTTMAERAQPAACPSADDGNDLPIGLVVPRARLRYGENPVLLLYLLDEHAYTPEQVGLERAARDLDLRRRTSGYTHSLRGANRPHDDHRRVADRDGLHGVHRRLESDDPADAEQAGVPDRAGVRRPGLQNYAYCCRHAPRKDSPRTCRTPSRGTIATSACSSG